MRQQIRRVIYKSETAVSIDLCYCMGKQGNKRLRRHNSPPPPSRALSFLSLSLSRTNGGRVRSSSSLKHTCHTRGAPTRRLTKGVWCWQSRIDPVIISFLLPRESVLATRVIHHFHLWWTEGEEGKKSGGIRQVRGEDGGKLSRGGSPAHSAHEAAEEAAAQGSDKTHTIGWE